MVATDPKKVSAIEVWPRPTTVEDLERFLATTVFLRAHLSPRYSHIAKPLRDLLSSLHEKRARRRAAKAKGKSSTQRPEAKGSSQDIKTNQNRIRFSNSESNPGVQNLFKMRSNNR